jgi:hypothetical protein
MAIVPLLDGDRVHGALTYVYHSTATRFPPSEVAFLERLAALVSLATQNIRLREIETRQRNVLEAVFATVPVGMAVVAGNDFRFKLANAAYRGLTPHPKRSCRPPLRRHGVRQVSTGSVLANRRHRTENSTSAPHARLPGRLGPTSPSTRRLPWGGGPVVLVVLMNTTATRRRPGAARQSAPNSHDPVFDQ